MAPQVNIKGEPSNLSWGCPGRHPLFLLTTTSKYTWSYIFIHHTSWVLLGLYYRSLCLFCFLVCHNYPCWTHLFERAIMMLWFVRIALCASLKFFELWNWSSAALISFSARCALLFLKKFSHASLRFIWELVNFWRNSLLLHLNYFERRNFLCSCSSLISVWAY